MLSRRQAIYAMPAAAAFVTAAGTSSAAAEDVAGSVDQKAIEESITNWAKDEANKDFFFVPAEPGRGSLILPPDDDRVIEAAALLAKAPKKRPIDIVKYLIANLPNDAKVEWPRDRPGDPKPANPVIVAFFAATGLFPTQGDQTAWCAALMCWALKRAGIANPASAASRSFRTWGTKVETPEIGDVVVFRNPADPTYGHVAFFDGFDGTGNTAFFLVGGNQRDSISRIKWPVNISSPAFHSYRTVPGLRA